MVDKLLSIEETARSLGGLSTHTIRAWIRNGKMNRTKVGRRTMIRESELSKVIRDEQPRQHNRELRSA
jgi:excisionase family DNA binding protein